MDWVKPQPDLLPRIQVPSTELICNETLILELRVANILSKIYIYFFQWILSSGSWLPRQNFQALGRQCLAQISIWGVSPQTYHTIDCLFQRCLKFFQMIGYLIVAVVEEMGHSKLSLLNRISPWLSLQMSKARQGQMGDDYRSARHLSEASLFHKALAHTLHVTLTIPGFCGEGTALQCRGV